MLLSIIDEETGKTRQEAVKNFMKL